MEDGKKAGFRVLLSDPVKNPSFVQGRSLAARTVFRNLSSKGEKKREVRIQGE